MAQEEKGLEKLNPRNQIIGSTSRKSFEKTHVVRYVSSGACSISPMSMIKSGSNETQLACWNECPLPKPAVQPEVCSSRPKPGDEKEKKREKFSVSLSWKEIEEDFMKMVNQRPSRRPKKRNKNVQDKIDNLFPGLGLTEVTADMYKVRDSDKKKNKKSKSSKSK